MVALGACAKDAEFSTRQRQLPPAPGFAQTVYVAPERGTDSCWNKHAEEQNGRKRANSIITRFRQWYEGVRKDYSTKI